MKFDFVKSIEAYYSKMNSLIEIARTVAINFKGFKVVPFDYQNLTVKDLSQFDVSNVLYFFEVDDYGSKMSSKEFCKHIQEIKNTTKGSLNLPLVNTKNAFFDDGILYVGKSNGNFKIRLKHHLGLGSSKTYALHLKKWKDYEVLCNIKLSLHYASIDLKKYEIENREQEKDILELLESALHLQFEPLLGRSGH